MKVIRAKKMGFCFGVKEAINLANSLLKSHKHSQLFILGMLVHNEQVIFDLKKMGIHIISENELNSLSGDDILIIRAHGTTKNIYMKLNDKNIKVFDAACIFVKKARNLIIAKEKEGFKILFVGDKHHPEVNGIVSFVDNVKIFKNLNDLKKFTITPNLKYFLICQTTFNTKEFQLIKEYLKNFQNVVISDTACNATHERQAAVENLANIVDIVIIIGGFNSSNTCKLYNLAKQINLNSYHVQTKNDIKEDWFFNKNIVGITAGASTPEKSIKEIEDYIKEAF